MRSSLTFAVAAAVTPEAAVPRAAAARSAPVGVAPSDREAAAHLVVPADRSAAAAALPSARADHHPSAALRQLAAQISSVAHAPARHFAPTQRFDATPLSARVALFTVAATGRPVPGAGIHAITRTANGIAGPTTATSSAASRSARYSQLRPTTPMPMSHLRMDFAGIGQIPARPVDTGTTATILTDADRPSRGRAP